MKTHTSILILVLLTFAFPAPAQKVHQFTKGLVVGPCHQYGREATYTDQLAYQLYMGSLQTPTEGKVLFTNEKGEAITWKTATANNENKFKERDLSNGYLYLTYEADRDQAALLTVTGNSMVYLNGVPRSGDIYASGWMNLPVQLRKGLNELYIRGSRFSFWEGITATLSFPEKSVLISTQDSTLPHIVIGSTNAPLWGALVIRNGSSQTLTGLQFKSQVEGKLVTTPVPLIPPMTTRKVGFQLDAANVKQKGAYTCRISLLQKGQVLDEQEIKLAAVDPHEHHSNTFVSAIDGSIQYYGVAPQSQPNGNPPALFLSVHGAGVEAIGQARAYQPKNWGVLVAPTNRRPRGFNWEDWGRLDALEVLEIATKKFNPDPQHIYLTGHSMGGHGTWYLGATYPGKWAAIAPCAGYPTLSAYGSADGKIPESSRSGMEKLLLQASNPSNVLELAQNYKAAGVYIHHGDSDKVVSVEYAQQMRQLLSTFHQDFSYYEYPGGGHWFGNESVDWAPIFDYFQWHSIARDSAVNAVTFVTANPAISATYRWVSILQQQKPLQYSRIQLARNKALKTISGTTENCAALSIALQGFKKGDTLTLLLDKQAPIRYVLTTPETNLYLYNRDTWQIGTKPIATQKGVQRNGTFKEPFNHRMVFVYSTAGTAEENAWSYNKARYDAEVWYYRGNGAVDMVADKDFTLKAYAERGVILYGNATTNHAWKKLLAKCPITVQRGGAKIGGKQYTGDNIGAYFIWPRADSEVASVAVISGTGLKGMQAADANQYFAAGSGFPDYMLFSTDMLKDGSKGIKIAGFYGNDWSLEKGQSVTQE